MIIFSPTTVEISFHFRHTWKDRGPSTFHTWCSHKLVLLNELWVFVWLQTGIMLWPKYGKIWSVPNKACFRCLNSSFVMSVIDTKDQQILKYWTLILDHNLKYMLCTSWYLNQWQSWSIHYNVHVSKPQWCLTGLKGKLVVFWHECESFVKVWVQWLNFWASCVTKQLFREQILSWTEATVHPETILSASLFPHFVMLQPYSTMGLTFFSQNFTHNSP